MRQISVLVVEDDVLNSKLETTALQEGGYNVYAAQSIEDCLIMLERDKPDIIVLDRGLPDGDGAEFCTTLKKDPLFRSIPVIMLTGNVEAGDNMPGFGWSADDYLAKPYDIEELLEKVNAVVKRFYGEAADGGRPKPGRH